MSNLADIRPKKIVINVPEAQLVTMNLDKERHLKFDLNAFAMLEEKYGSIDEALRKIENGSITALRFILWAGLVHEDPTLTVEDVGRMFDIRNLSEVSKQIFEAVGAAMPSREGGDLEDPSKTA